MRSKLCVPLAISLVLTAVSVAPAHAGTCPEFELLADSNNTVSANLSGSAVVGGGDPDGSGTVVLTIDISNKNATISYQLDTTNVATPLEGAHIHVGPVGQTGRSVVTLFTFSDQPDRSGVVSGVSKCLAHDILHRPNDYYVDVHNQEFPDQGAVRGQLQ